MLRRPLVALCVLGLSGCTFNVSSFARDVTSDLSSAPTRVRTDVSGLADLGGFDLTITGDPTATSASATVTIAGLLGSGGSADEAVRGVQIAWPDDPMLAGGHLLTVGYAGTAAETYWTEGMRVSVPSTTALDVNAGATSVYVHGVDADVRVVADSGSIGVEDAGHFELAATSGSISVTGHDGTATCTSGSIATDVTGALVAHATSGSIAGRFGGGGELSADSGSLDLELVGALDRDLTLSAGSGSIHLVVPTGTSMRVETHTGSGSSHVQVGGVDSGDDFTGTIGAGGFLVRATTGSGSITITER